MAVLAAIPSASVAMAMSVNPGDLSNVRQAYLRSEIIINYSLGQIVWGDGKFADAFAGCGENGVNDCRHARWDRRFSNSEWFFRVAADQMDFDRRRIAHSWHRKIGEGRLLRRPAFEGNTAFKRG